MYLISWEMTLCEKIVVDNTNKNKPRYDTEEVPETCVLADLASGQHSLYNRAALSLASQSASLFACAQCS